MGIIEGASNTNRGAWWDGLWFGERPDSPVVAGDLGFDPLGVMPKDPKAADLMRLKELKNGRCPANANVRTHTSTKVSLRGAPACLSRTPRHAGCLRPLYAAPLVSEGMTLCGQRTMDDTFSRAAPREQQHRSTSESVLSERSPEQAHHQ